MAQRRFTVQPPLALFWFNVYDVEPKWSQRCVWCWFDPYGVWLMMKMGSRPEGERHVRQSKSSPAIRISSGLYLLTSPTCQPTLSSEQTTTTRRPLSAQRSFHDYIRSQRGLVPDILHLYMPSPWIWKGVSATLQSGRYTLSYPRGRRIHSARRWSMSLLISAFFKWEANWSQDHDQCAVCRSCMVCFRGNC